MVVGRRALTRTAAAMTTLGVALGGLMVVSTTQADAALVETDYGFQGTAYGTRVWSQDTGVQSGATAYSWIACTRLVGRVADNHVADISLPADDSFIHLADIASDNETFRKRSEDIDAAIRSTNTIGNVRLGGSSTPQLEFESFSATSTAWATRAGKLKARNDLSVLDMSLTGIADPGGSDELSQLFDALDAGIDELVTLLRNDENGIEIPGLGRVSLGHVRHAEKKDFAVAAADVLRVRLYGQDMAQGGTDDAIIAIGHSRARINRDVTAGVMGGVGYGANAEALDGMVSIGELGAMPLGCRGTEGDVVSSATAMLNFLSADQLDAVNLRGRVMGKQYASGRAVAWTEGSVGNLKLGPLEIRGIVGRVNLAQNRAGKLVRQDIAGSSIGKILVDGESQGSFDPSTADEIPPIEIPGVASIDFFVRSKSSRGISVSAVVIRVADGTPGVSTIRLGNAYAHLKRR